MYIINAPLRLRGYTDWFAHLMFASQLMYVRFSQHYEVSSILEIQNLNNGFTCISIFDIKNLNVRVSL